MRKLELLILTVYKKLPRCLQQNDTIVSWVQPIAERKLCETRKAIIRDNWKRVELEKQLDTLMSGHL